MKKKIYIIPGWQDTCNLEPYQRLATAARELGYEPIFKNIDWKQPLSVQKFEVEKSAVVFGFSLGAILAWMVAQDYPCHRLILASMTPHYSFEDLKIRKALVDLAGEKFVSDVITNLRSNHKGEKQIIMYGEFEGEKADILVPGTEHELNNVYIKEIQRLL